MLKIIILYSLYVISICAAEAFGKSETLQCPPACNCTKVGSSIHVICCKSEKQKLKTIPVLPVGAVSADFSSCQINEIPPGVFQNLSSLLSLDVSGHHLTKLNIRQFEGLINLTSLRISHGGEHLRDLQTGTFSRLISLKYLDVSFNEAIRLSQLPAVLDGLNNTNISELYLDGINSYKYSTEQTLTFNHVQAIERLNLRILSMINMCVVTFEYELLKLINRAKCFSFASNFYVLFAWQYVAEVIFYLSKNTNTRVLQMTNQAQTVAVADDQNSVAYSKRLRLDLLSACQKYEHDELSETNTPSLPPSSKNELAISFTIFRNVRYINMDRCVRGFGFGNINLRSNHLRVLSSQHTTGLELVGPIKGFNHLEALILSGSHITIKDPNTLSFMPALRILNLSFCHLENQTRSENSSLVRNMPLLETLDLTGNGISTINLDYLHQQAPNLTHLSLSNNKLTSIPTIVSAGKLQQLNLSGNKFAVLDAKDCKTLEVLAGNNPTIVINLSGNPFDCQCTQMTFDFLKWIQKTEVGIHEVSNLTCTVPGEKAVVQKAMLSLHGGLFGNFWYQCYRTWIVGLGGFLLGVLVLTTIIITVYRNRWGLRYRYYTTWGKLGRLRRKQSHRAVSESDDETDPLLATGSQKVVFVIYVYDDTSDESTDRTSSPEYKFAHEQLEPAIRDSGFTPIFYQEPTSRVHPLPGRFLGNKPEIAEVCEVISESCCAFILVSKALKFDQSYKWLVPYSFERSPRYPFALMYGKTDYEDLMQEDYKSLNGLLKQGRYAEWSSEETARRLFFDRVRDHLNEHQ